ncbi:ethanolamine ammonia-lyase reactivating factor EutA [Marinobacter sp. BSs20148]|jgi:ethanolamine utilization protein EutA|uniref:ethanolamine ammonia-lyase reactivating factor EutA n=1 Tax=Marinobacter sp. BSs20148 TaxID=490759 RepID=UPI0005A0608F|nr:ethanolamine ammonia-lyase reactivating factor EutA [Marinobacter sp. BSs20148]
MSDAPARRIFSSVGRSLEQEDEIRLTSVGVDIGSSTSHLVFSRIVMEQVGNRYIVTERSVFHESEVLLTPYTDNMDINADQLGTFIDRQYELAGLAPTDIDTGALILTGVAVRRSNARAIGELFASQAGKFVAVSAGDSLETTLVAFGSGAAALSKRENLCTMNVDIGGGTSKIAICSDGEVTDLTAIDVGARIICFDAEQRITYMEEAGRRFADEAGLLLKPGDRLSDEQISRIVDLMAKRLFQAMGGQPMDKNTVGLLRLDPLKNPLVPDALSFSGGVSEYIYAKENTGYGDLGPMLAEAVARRVKNWGPKLVQPTEGLRATVVGASQYTIQVSGSTIFVEPHNTLPVRNVPVITPDLLLESDDLDIDSIAEAIRLSLRRLDLQKGDQPVAICFRWQNSATFGRLDAFCRGVIKGLAQILDKDLPLILVSDGDIGGLIGLHCSETLLLDKPIVSIDGIKLKEFDFIDIGALMESSGAVPVVIKSLIFPPSAALGKTGEEQK